MAVFTEGRTTSGQLVRMEDFLIPEWMAYPLEYGDYSELNESDERQLKNFIEDADLHNCSFTFGEEREFSWYNDTFPGQQGATCIEVTVTWIGEAAEALRNKAPQTWDECNVQF